MFRPSPLLLTLLLILLFISGHTNALITTSPLVALPELNGDNFAQELNRLKGEGLVSKWACTNLAVSSRVTKTDVLLVSRSSFPECSDYYGQLLKNAQEASKRSPFRSSFTALSASSILSAAVIVPQLPLPDTVRSFLGSVLIFFPFSALAASVALPGFVRGIEQQISKAMTPQQAERILYHEAGHVLAGFLTGVPVVNYSIQGDTDSVTTIESSGTELGSLLIVCMAGVVAESLRFGITGSSSSGGSTDFQLAYKLLNASPSSRLPLARPPPSLSGSQNQQQQQQQQQLYQKNIERARRAQLAAEAAETDGSLRWAVVKALTLLRLYRRELDATADVMRRGGSISEIVRAIESTSVSVS